MELTNFQIFKNNKKAEGSKQPDFRITSKINEKFVDVGACWWKTDTKGNYYQSCVLKNPNDESWKEKKDLEPKDIPF